METLIEQLRKVNNWDKSPNGFVGACLLAEKSEDGARILNRFIIDLKQSVEQPWLNTALKNANWYKE